MLVPVLGLAVVVFPVLLMVFALSMDRVETRLSRFGTVKEREVENFLEHANAADVGTLASEGMPRALAVFRRRRERSRRPSSRRRIRVR